MSDKAKRIVIVGCGIAGPALGMFLHRIGIEVTLHEGRDPSARDEGAFLGIAPNGMNVLAALGVHEDIERISTPCDRFEFQNHRGAPIGEIDRKGDDAKFGARLRIVRRAALHDALTRAAMRRGIPIVFGRRLTGVDTRDPARVTARFEDGHEAAGDALLGCDGIRSRTRELVLPNAPRPAYSGLVDIAGITHLPEVPLAPRTNVMVFGRRAFFGAFKTEAGNVLWFHNGGEPAVTRGPFDPVRERARILERHEGDPPWIREVVLATPELLGPYPLHDILSLPQWHAGRVCLVGDAAHATTPSAGQGASLALEDAMVLARCLRDEPSPMDAFAAFEAARRPRVEAIVKASRRIGNTKATSGPVSEWMRDRLLPFFLRWGTKSQERQYAHRISWA